MEDFVQEGSEQNFMFFCLVPIKFIFKTTILHIHEKAGHLAKSLS